MLPVLLAGAIPAAAQTTTKFAGNVDQQPTGGLLSGVPICTDVSQRFTTGSNSDGYSLQHIGLRTEATVSDGVTSVQYVVADIVCTGDEERVADCPWVGNPFSVSVCRVLANGYPDRSACTRLDPPDNFEIGWKIFTADQDAAATKVFLAPNTTYTLLLSSGNQKVVYGVTDADAEDATSPPGWSIWNHHDYYSSRYIWTPHATQTLRTQLHFIAGIPKAVITSVAVTSTPPSDSYGSGDSIEFTVTFNEAVTVVGDPEFNFSLGEFTTAARYDADRSTATSLVFRYTVQSGDEDTDGIWVGSGPQTFTLDADDQIRTVMSGIDALLDHNALGTLSGHTVDALRSAQSIGEEPTDSADLSGLALSDASDDSPIPLNPVFAPDHTRYTAFVTHAVDTITVEPTPTHAGARVAYLDANNAAIPDADSGKDGHQVALRVGQTTIKGQVTAEDTTTTQTYTTTVSRAPPPLSNDASLRGLAVSNAADDSPISLNPVFTPDHTRYTASVTHAVATITIEPTPTHIGARVAYLDANNAAIPDADSGKDGRQVVLPVGRTTIKGRVTAENGTATQTYTVVVSRASETSSRADVPPPQDKNGSDGSSTRSNGGGRSTRSSGGGGGGGGNSSRDDHGNTAAQATPVTLDPARMATTAGQLNTPDDVDYFTVAVPQAGTLVVETTGSTDTVGTVWQDDEELATDDNSGTRRNFRLSVRVAAGPVVIAVAGSGTRTGAYTLQTTLLVGYLENPGPNAFQSGIGVISGWVCDAEAVEIELNGARQVAAYGTERLDTESVCGDTDNGFGLLFNWNLLGDGAHEVVAFVDGVELGRATVTVTTLGVEFLQGVQGETVVVDFPSPGEAVRLIWQQANQNFVLAPLP